MSVVSTERIFSLSAFEGLRLFRQYRSSRPELPQSDVIALIVKLEPDGSAVDLEAAAYLHGLVSADCPMDGAVFYQECIKVVVINHQPLWAKAMRSGRKAFVSKLQPDDQDIFRAAGLMGDPPEDDVVNWWDNVVGHARLITDVQKMQQAREAERLTFNLESERLQKEGISKKPEWPGLDNNFAGYDILSYQETDSGLTNQMIEVKSTVASPLRFIVTRNEWNQASKAPDAYLFHIWDMAKSPPLLYVRTVPEVEPHIPSDNSKGVWKDAEIPLGI